MLNPKYEIDQFDRYVLRKRSRDFYLYIKKNPGATLRQITRHFDMNERNLRRVMKKLLTNRLIKTKLKSSKRDKAHYYYVTRSRVNIIGI